MRNKNLAEEVLDLYEMANLSQKETGLPMMIFVSPKGGARHGARIKVARTHSHKVSLKDVISISISDTPEIKAGTAMKTVDFELVKAFILANKAILLQYWDSAITTSEFIKKLKKI